MRTIEIWQESDAKIFSLHFYSYLHIDSSVNSLGTKFVLDKYRSIIAGSSKNLLKIKSIKIRNFED